MEIINLWKDKPTAVASTTHVAEAAALSLEIEGQCPKCKAQMGHAYASGEQVYYCEPCRVALPLPIN